MTLFGWAGLAGTTFAAALLQAVSGFGFAVLAVPLYPSLSSMRPRARARARVSGREVSAVVGS
jgi:uncharacterized membrane protein YfcA